MEKILIVDQPDFKKFYPEFDGQRKIWFCECQELIEGHWEGFVSIFKSYYEAMGGKSEEHIDLEDCY